MATSPDIRCQSVPMGYHRVLGRGSPSWGGVRGAPVSWMLVFPSGRCSLSSLPKRPQIPGWGMCLGREFHPNGTGPGPGAGLPLRFSLPIWLRHTGSGMQMAASSGTPLQRQLSPHLSQVPAKELAGWRPRSGHSSIPAAGTGPCTADGERPSLPSHCGFSLHPSRLIQFPSLAVPGTAEGTENLWRAGNRVCQGEGRD